MKNEREISDTDALKQCRIELSESEYKLLLFSSQCTDQLAILSRDGHFKFTASLCENFLGYTDEELMKKTIFDLAERDDLTELSKAIDTTKDNTDLAMQSLTGRMRHKSGTWHWFKMTFTNKCNDPLILGIIAKFWDITDEKVSEEKILQLNRLYAFSSQINKAISHSENEQLLLEEVCKIAVEIGKFKAAWVGILDSDTGKMDTIGNKGISTDACAQFIADYFENLEPFDQIQKSGDTIVCNLIETNFNFSHHSSDTCSGFMSFIILPIKKADNIVGTLTLCAADSNFFTTDEITLLEEATADLSHELDSIERLRKKRKEIALLRKTEANLQAIVNSTSEGFVLTDTEGIILECNNNAKNAVFLYSQTELKTGANIFDFVPTDRKQDFNSFFLAVMSGKTITYDNSYGDLWYNFSISPVYDINIITGLCLSFRDITERKLAEHKLVKSELFNKDVLASLSSHIAVINFDGSLVAINKAWEDFAEANNPLDFPNLSIGSNYFDVCNNAIAMGDDDAKKTLQGIMSVFNKERDTFQMEYPCHSPDEKRWFTLHVSSFGADDSKVVISHQNITTRKIAEIQLNETSNELQKTLLELNKIVDSSLDVICTINSDGRFVNVSKASREMWGYHAEELVGNKFMDLVYKEDWESSAQAASEIFNGKQIPSFENRYVHRNGKLVSLLWSTNYDEKTGLMYCVGKDVSEQRRLEKAIERERDQFYNMFLQAPSAVGFLKGPNHTFEMANPLYLKLTGKKNIIGKSVAEVFPEVQDQGFIDILNHVYQTGESHIGTEVLVKIDTENNGHLTNLYINFIYQPNLDEQGAIDGVFFFINDVSEQVIAKQTIEKSEKFFKGVIESSADMIILLDETGKRTYATPAVINRFGYTLEEAPNLHLTEVIHPEDIAVASAFFSKVLKNPLVPMASPILRALKRDGTHFWVEGTMTNFLDTEGINGVVTNFRDVTERKVAEDNLSRTLVELDSERNRLLTAQRVSKIGSWETNLKTFHVKWSDEMHRIFGTDPETFDPSHYDFLRLVAPEDRERVDQALMNSFTTDGTNCIEHHIVMTNGTRKCVEENWTVSKNEKGVATIAIGTCQDITDRKEAADKVLKSETRLKVAQLIAQVGSWEVDLLTDEHTWSDEFYRILGINENTLPSEKAFLSNIHPDDRAMAAMAMRTASSVLTNSMYAFRYIDEDGELGYASTEWRFEFDSNGVPTHIYGILRDLTKVKVAENERIRMISDLMQRNKDLEQFSYIISHNLRAPVANIMGLAEELSDDSYDAETKLILTEALSSDVKRLENVIADLNTILQTKREITELKEPVSLSELVTDIKLSINDLIQMQGVHINIDFKDVDEINTIKSYIQSIFFNLITNSIKYRKPFADSIIDIKSHIDDGKLVIVFKDNGSGIDLTKKGDQIFGLYKRFHANTEGKGMGLYMVKTQVETLGGTISVSSEVNVGTKFVIEFGYHE